MKTTLKINGSQHTVDIDSRTTLLDVLRNELNLTGTKKGCDHGQCGACTLLVDDRRINSCLTLAVMYQGASITTIEGLGSSDGLNELQSAFVEHDGYQCGYCTPGQICSATGMLKEAEAGWPSVLTDDLSTETSARSLSKAEVAERMSGNLCRCSAYPNMHDAILEVAGKETA